jgi:D-3-phosphoglycerate dehydrogenase
MIYTTNKDVPGIIGVLGKTLGDNNINIANFTLGRKSVGGEAIALLSIDAAATDQVVKNLKETLLFQQVQPLSFMVN